MYGQIGKQGSTDNRRGFGNGPGIVPALFQGGAKIVVVDFNEENGKKVVDEVKAQGGQAAFVYADVSKGADCKNAADFAVETFGKIDIVFCCGLWRRRAR